uniref:Transmembrane protein 107 n=1 Tax=Ovis aries TaxID=9940 RepID=A0AC11E451_SHEEP
MGRISGLVPSRFLTLLAHLVVVITLFWSRVRPRALFSFLLPIWGGPSPTPPFLSRGLTRWGLPISSRQTLFQLLFLSALLPRTATSRPACLSDSPLKSMRSRTFSELVAALSVTLALFAVELAGFFLGVSMFNSTQSLISIGAHCSASVALSFFIFERWECTMYWYIFVFCSALPAVTEITLFISVFGLKKKPF